MPPTPPVIVQVPKKEPMPQRYRLRFGAVLPLRAMLTSRLLSASLLLALVASLPACGKTGAPPPSAPSALLDGNVPEFQRPSFDAATAIDTNALRGKVVVIKFFAKYCEPCKRTLPELEALHQSHADVVFVGVGEDENVSDVKAMVQQFGLTFPVIHDVANVLSGRFRVREMPMTFVVGKQGQVRWVGGPAQTGSDVEAAIVAAGR